MNGLQLINLLTGQQPGQANGGALNGLNGLGGLLGGGSASGASGPGGGLFHATLSSLLNGAANVGMDISGLVPGVGAGQSAGQSLISGEAQPGLGIGLVNPDSEASALLAAQGANGNTVAGQVATSGGQGVPVAAESSDAAKSALIDGELADSVLASAAPAALADLQIFRDAEAELALSGTNAKLDNLSLFGEGASSPFLNGAATSTPAELLAAAKSAASEKITGIGLDGVGKANKASKAQGLLHASPTAVSAILASAANGKNPVFTGETTAPATGGEASAASASVTPLAAPVAPADVAAARQVAAQKGSPTGQENSSGKEAAAENGTNTGSDAGSDKGSGNSNGFGSNSGHGGQAPGQAPGQTSAQAGGAHMGVQLANADHASNIGINAPGQKVAEAAIMIDRGAHAGMFAPLDSGVADDPFFGFQTSSSASGSNLGSNVGFSAVQPGSVSLASATGASQPGAPASFAQPHHPASAQVGMQVTRAVVNGNSEFTVRLNPKELGRVEARLEFTADKGVRAYFVAESRETLAILQKDSHILERALADAGIDTNSADLNFSLKKNGEGFADGSFGGSADGEGSFGENGLAGDEAPMMDVTDQIVRHVISDSAVDITI